MVNCFIVQKNTILHCKISDFLTHLQYTINLLFYSVMIFIFDYEKVTVLLITESCVKSTWMKSEDRHQHELYQIQNLTFHTGLK